MRDGRRCRWALAAPHASTRDVIVWARVLQVCVEPNWIPTVACWRERSMPLVPDQQLGQLGTRAMVAGRLGLGLLLGLAPLLMVLSGYLTLQIPGASGLAIALLMAVAGVGFFCLDVLIVLPLLAIHSTRTLGIGLAAGIAIVGGLLAFVNAHGFWNILFG